MKAVEFHTKLHSSGSIEIPESFRGQMRTGEDVRVIVLMNDEVVNTDRSWKDVVTKQFFAGYPDADSEYDKL